MSELEYRMSRLEHPAKYKKGQKIREGMIICGEPKYEYSRSAPYWKYNVTVLETGDMSTLNEWDIDYLLIHNETNQNTTK